MCRSSWALARAHARADTPARLIGAAAFLAAGIAHAEPTRTPPTLLSAERGDGAAVEAAAPAAARQDPKPLAPRLRALASDPESAVASVETPPAPSPETAAAPNPDLAEGVEAALTPLRQAIADVLKAPRLRNVPKARRKAIKTSYEAYEYAPVWARESGGGALDWTRGREALDAARSLHDHALPAPEKKIAALSARLEGAGAMSLNDAARLELELSAYFIEIADRMASGVIAPRSLSKDMDVKPRRRAPAALLDGARPGVTLTAYLEALAPHTADYAGLKALYARYLDGENSALWAQEIAPGKSLKVDSSGPRVAQLRARLIALGEMPTTAPTSLDPDTGAPMFDAAVDAAVRRFQAHYGLMVDGIVGRNTIRELNRTAEDRAMQVAVNMERRRWRNFAMAERRVEVNIPDYHVVVLDGGREIYKSRVVVGKRKHQTPEFDDEMTNVVINPSWNVPKSIATQELLPELQVDPSQLFNRNMEVILPGYGVVNPWDVDWWELSEDNFPFRLKQLPGPGNALGEVKFIFPNKHAVYLHDTPAKRLFSRDQRAYSHGCVRVAKPVELAEVLLAAQKARPLDFYQRMRAREDETFVKLDEVVPVHLMYRTLWIDQDGMLQIRADVYGRDRLVARALGGAGLSVEAAVAAREAAVATR